MSEECEKWLSQQHVSEFEGINADHVYSAWDHQQEKIDAQAEELKGFRVFSEFVINKANEGIFIGVPLNWIVLSAETFGIIDTDGNPTKLLTGEKK